MKRETITDEEFHSGVKGSMVLTTKANGPDNHALILASDYGDDFKYPEDYRVYNHPQQKDTSL